MDGLPDGINVGNFIGKEFHEVENASDGEDERVCEDLKLLGKMDDAEALEETESGDGGIDVEAGGEASSEDQAESFEGVHGCNQNYPDRQEISKYHENGRAGEVVKCLRTKAGGRLNWSGTRDHTERLKCADDHC